MLEVRNTLVSKLMCSELFLYLSAMLYGPG